MASGSRPEEFDALATYDTAAEEYEEAAGRYWGFLTTRTLELLALREGERVLDVATGTGLLLPDAARAVGPRGYVVGVDVAPAMLAVARRRVQPLANVGLARFDVTALPPARFDAISCVLGLFFVTDRAALVGSLVDRLAPGGRLAVAVFGEQFFEPLIGVFVDAVQTEAPGTAVAQPWSRTATEESFLGAFTAAGVDSVAVVTQRRQVPIDPAGWRRIATGSGLRATLEDIGPAAERVLRRCDDHITRHGIDHATVSARYAVVQR